MQERSIERRQGLHEVLYLTVLSRHYIKGTPLPPPQALCNLYQGKHKMHLTDDEVQYTMGRTNKKGEVTSCPFPPSHLPLHTNFQRERSVWV